MKTFTHRYLLPPILVSIHALFLIPILIPLKIEHEQPSSPSDSNHEALDAQDDVATQPKALNFTHAVYFGIASFAFVYILKQIAGRIPLPASRSRRQLAIWMELVILFTMGALEEIWRWGVVHLLVNTEMGIVGSEHFGSARPIWRTIYAAGWVWSLVECAFSWWGFRPDGNEEEEERTLKQQPSPRPSYRTRPRRTFSQQSVPALSTLNNQKGTPSNRRDSLTALRRGSVLAFPGNENPFMSSPQARIPAITWQSGTEGNRSAASLLSGQDTAAARSDEQAPLTPLFNETFAFPSPSTRPITAFSPAFGPQPTNAAQDLSDFPARHLEDSDFGDDEEDARSITSFSSITSSLRSGMSNRSHPGAETPLLSSSLAHDDHHHHHESHSLLSNTRRMSYHTIAQPPNGLHPYSEDDEEDSHITVRDYEFDLEGQPAGSLSAPGTQHGQNVTFQETDFLLQQDQRREYPSFSNQYNSSHFSPHPNHHNAHESSSSATAVRPPTYRYDSTETQSYQRLLYGVSVNSLSPILPIIWRTSALLRHLACTLLFAFFPAILKHRGGIQWWTVGVVMTVASLKGWYTVEWLGGNVARSGVGKVTGVTAAVSVVLFLGVLGVWGVV
ncbi:hypothetical protein BJ508DRAFT_308119 [Ascobolus immersus RN42]|uniref:Uncharacterized protein n=1 Tax=Ascobolus immersus RN42 TaxID=1160509 RepID=A0A3N4I0K2_ASCIM|nr:hypothetical protein BJ508DRAFT_308119 [Ascobolus immersus RN42]